MNARNNAGSILIIESDCEHLEQAKDILSGFGFELLMVSPYVWDLRTLMCSDFALIMLAASELEALPDLEMSALLNAQNHSSQIMILGDLPKTSMHHHLHHIYRLPLPLEANRLLIRVNAALMQYQKCRAIDVPVMMNRLNAPLEQFDLYRYLVEKFPGPLFVLDDQLNFVYVNSKFETLMKLPFGACLEENFCSVFPKADGDKLQYFLGHNQDHEQSQGLRLIIQFQEARPNIDPKGLWLDVSIMQIQMPVPVHNSQNNQHVAGFYGTLTDITQQKREQLRLRRSIHFDSLTHLPNRGALTHILGQTLLRQNSTHGSTRLGRTAVIFIKLINLANLNESSGYTFGDKVLVAATEIIKNNIRSQDRLCRFDGDVLVLVATRFDRVEDVVRIAEKLVNKLCEPLTIDLQEVLLDPKIGCAISSDTTETVDSLIQKSAGALRLAQSTEKPPVCLYRAGMNRAARHLTNQKQKLRQAIRDGDMVPFFQPIVDMRTGLTMGFEALVRWPQPDGQVVPPSEFLDLVSEMGLMVPLDQSLQHKAFDKVGHWNALYDSSYRISVNVTTEQLVSENFLGKMLDQLQLAKLQPELVTLEFVEYSIFPDKKTILPLLSQIRAAGISLAIDDFGTGYSSLSYLNQLPLDMLKIDRSFVTDISNTSRDRCIITAIANLAKALKLEIIAEGIETHYQARELLRLGCYLGQGYLFSTPLNAAETQDILRLQAASSKDNQVRKKPGRSPLRGTSCSPQREAHLAQPKLLN